VLGAGPAGLSAARHLGRSCEVIEKQLAAGGHCRTKRIDGFCFDEGAHVFFGTGECAERFVWKPLERELLRSKAEIWNNYGGRRYGRYPVQVNAHALPAELATLCVLGFIDALNAPEQRPHTYADWCYASFGKAFSDHFMLRYARKIWTVEPAELSTEWLGSSVGGRISRPSLEQVLRGAIDPEPQVLSYFIEFAYPRAGGFDRVLDALREGVDVKLGLAAVEINTAARTLRLSDGSSRRYSSIVSTMPLPELVRIADAPPEVQAAGERLMWTSVRCVNFGVARSDLGPGHWVYFYDDAVPFFRVSFPSKFAAGNAPAGHGSISCEIAHSRRRPLDETDLIPRVRASLVDAGILDARDEVVLEDEVEIPYAYVVYDFERTAALETIHAWMRRHGLFPCGRYAEWGYHWSFDSMESGRRVAREVAAATGLATAG
jgi:protoporphyrinogen oxidase